MGEKSWANIRAIKALRILFEMVSRLKLISVKACWWELLMLMAIGWLML
jgi:hypothetical protein